MLVDNTPSRLPIRISLYNTGEGVAEICHKDTSMLKLPATI